MIPALVLTAGLATRLRPLSFVRAKAALPIGGEPLARRILRQLGAAGVTDAVLNLHHLPATLAGRVGDGSDIGVRVRYSWESPEVLGSAGGPRRAAPIVGASRFLVVNGDTLTDADLRALVAAHAASHDASGTLVTMAVIPNDTPDRYSGLRLDAAGRVLGVVPRGSGEPSFHFVGVQVVEAEAFMGLADGVPAESVRELYPALTAARPDAVRAHVCRASFLDIGTPGDYARTCLALNAREGRTDERGARVEVAPSARLDRTLLWDDVRVGADAALRECIVTDGVTIPAGSSWTRQIIRRADTPAAPGEVPHGDLLVSALD